MNLRRRAPRVLALAFAIALTAAAPAAAAPRVVSVEGIQFVGSDGRANHVVIEVRTSQAGSIRLNWRGQGGARQNVQNGRAGIGFARRGQRSYRVSVQACKKGTNCSRFRRFSGRFRTVRVSTEPQPNSPPPPSEGQGPLTTLVDPLTGLPQVPPPPVPISNQTLPSGSPSVSGP